MIEQRSKVFLGGPPLVKMATGEDSDDESLGGADMHAAVSAASPTTSPSTSSTPCASAARSSRRLNRRKLGPAPTPAPADPPRYDPEELLGIAVGRPATSRSTPAT